MQHRIDLEILGPAGDKALRAVEGCVHCGFCLPVCPTYQQLGEEMDSPRGRIVLMKEVLEGNLAFDEAAPYVDRCLGCLACEPACPSGVGYRDLLHPFRQLARDKSRRSAFERLRRALVHRTLSSRSRLRMALGLARAVAPLAGLLPRRWSALLGLAAAAPRPLPRLPPLPPVSTPEGETRTRVALLLGCAQEVLSPQISRAATRVLLHFGAEVRVPPAQGCCGSLALHAGEGDLALELARQTIESFADEVDAIVTTAAGCGSGLHEVPLLLERAGEDATRARALASRVRDLSSVLDELVPDSLPALDRRLRVAYLGACHLEHAQGVRDAPRRLLQRVGNLDLVELDDGGFCCGSAGTYNLDQPAIAEGLGRAKAEAVLAAGVDAVASGNVGCLTQLRLHLDRLGSDLTTLHTVEILDRALAEGAAGDALSK